MLLDELAAGLDVVPHEDAEEVVGGARVVHADAEQRAVGRVERRLAELFGVHLAQALEAGDREALLARRADGGGQLAQTLQADLVLAAAEVVAAPLFARPLLLDERLDVEAELGQVLELGVDRADLVQLDDPQLRLLGCGSVRS